jgi:hypothetical protein
MSPTLPPLPPGAVPIDETQAAPVVPAGLPPLPPGAKSIINPDQPEAFQEPPQSNLVRLGQGFWSNTGAALGNAGKAVWDLMSVAGGDKKELDPATKQIWTNIIKAHQDQAQKAEEAWNKGEHMEAAGHALATVLPLVGPMAAHAGERMGDFTPPTYDKYGNVITPGRGPDIAGGIGEGLGSIFGVLGPSAVARAPGWISSIPNAARASAALEDVAQVAGKIPIDTTAPGAVALRAQQMARSGGSPPPKVIQDFLDRTTAPNKPPITFAEARDFYSNASKLSAEESGRISPGMYRQIDQFRDALNSSLEQAADQVGKADQYRAGIKEYRKAMRNQAIAKNVGKFAVKKALPAGAAYYEWQKLLQRKAEGGPLHDLERGPYSRDAALRSLQRSGKTG